MLVGERGEPVSAEMLSLPHLAGEPAESRRCASSLFDLELGAGPRSGSPLRVVGEVLKREFEVCQGACDCIDRSSQAACVSAA